MSEQKPAWRYTPEELLHIFEGTKKVDEQMLVEALREVVSQRDEARRALKLQREIDRIEAEMKADSMTKEDYLKLLQAELKQLKSKMLADKPAKPTEPPSGKKEWSNSQQKFIDANICSKCGEAYGDVRTCCSTALGGS